VDWTGWHVRREVNVNTIRRLKIYLLGQRDYPEAIVSVPEHLLGDLPDLVARARATNPALSLDAIIANIWRLGCYRLGQNLLRGIPVRVRDPVGRQSR
jgi:hypothetical protein